MGLCHEQTGTQYNYVFLRIFEFSLLQTSGRYLLTSALKEITPRAMKLYVSIFG